MKKSVFVKEVREHVAALRGCERKNYMFDSGYFHGALQAYERIALVMRSSTGDQGWGALYHWCCGIGAEGLNGK